MVNFLILFNINNAFTSDAKNRYEELAKADYLLLMDLDSEEILLEKNADEIIAPSSMTKLMTAYVVFRELQKNGIKLTNQCLIGRDAWRKQGSTMFLNHGDVVSIDELITGLIVVSGNDSSIALAQSVSGSIKSFAKLMNKTARSIGMYNSNFKNPHGLNESGHYMTLRDLATLTRRIHTEFPQFIHYFSIREFTYGNITQRNRNPLIKNDYEGATGMKTGYTSDGGYGIVGSATRNNRSLVGIANNTLDPKQRERTIMQLLDYGFDNFEKITLFSKDETVAKATVWLGKKEKLDLISKDEVAINVPLNQTIDDVDFEVKYQDPIFTPVKEGQKIGRLIIKIDDKITREIPLYAKEDINKANYFSRMWIVFKYKFNNVLKAAD